MQRSKEISEQAWTIMADESISRELEKEYFLYRTNAYWMSVRLRRRYFLWYIFSSYDILGGILIQLHVVCGVYQRREVMEWLDWIKLAFFFFFKDKYSCGSEVKASACNAGDLGSIPGSGRSPGEENGNPLQYPCLENPTDGGAWWVTVHGVAKSWTRLSDFTTILLLLWLLLVTYTYT